MRNPRIYHAEALSTGAQCTLSDFAFQHAIKVLRKQVGDTLTLFDGSGYDFDATITNIQRRDASLIINQARKIDNESPLHTTLLQAISKSDRMDYAIQKATELGVNQIIPIITAHSDKVKDIDKKRQHWRKVIIHACEQSYRSTLPKLRDPQPLESVLSNIQADAKLLMSLTERTQPLPSTARSAAMLVGPIAGFTEQEEQQAIESGYTPLHLSDRILRTETAGIVGLTLCQQRWGDYRFE